MPHLGKVHANEASPNYTPYPRGCIWSLTCTSYPSEVPLYPDPPSYPLEKGPHSICPFRSLARPHIQVNPAPFRS